MASEKIGPADNDSMENTVHSSGLWRKRQTYLSAFFIALFLSCSMSGTGHTQIYKWIDENGSVHYGQTPPEQGLASGTVEKIPLSQRYTPSRKRSKAASNATSSTLANEQTAAAESTVELFTTSWCGYCKKAREFFDARGVSFVEYDIEKDPAAAQRKQEIDGRPGVPFALVNGQPIHGFSPSAYDQALR